MLPPARSTTANDAVVRVALVNAVSVAGVLLLTDATLTEVPESKREMPEPAEVAKNPGFGHPPAQAPL